VTPEELRSSDLRYEDHLPQLGGLQGTDLNKMNIKKKFVLLSLLVVLNPASLTVGGHQSKSQPSGQEAPAAHQPESIESLKARLTGHISQPRFDPAAWGIKIVSIDTGKTLFEHNPQKYFSPASNAKLYTAALALDRLGPDFRVRTSLYSGASPDAAGTLKGDLIIYGRGDPLMTARLADGDYFKPLDPLVTALANAGVRRVEGDLIGDDSYFTGPPFGAGWEWDDLQADYGAEVSALTVEDNCLDIFVKPAERAGMPARITTGPQTSYITIINRTQTAAKGSETRVSVYRPVGENIVYVSGRVAMESSGYSGSIAVHNPAALFATIFKDALSRRGITVNGRARSIDWKYREVSPIEFDKLVELGSVESAPLKDVLRETLKPSQNMYAQLLLLQVGKAEETRRVAERESERTSRGAEVQRSRADINADEGVTTEQIGLDAMTEFLTRVGVKTGDVLLEEGSGLSRKDVITPNATVALLLFMNKHKWADVYRNALPIAGVDGTLERRMKGSSAAGNVRAKTGSLRYVFTLSGYVTSAAGERLGFSIMLNNYYNAERSAALKEPSQASRPVPTPREDIDAIAVMLAGFSGRTAEK
jgi:serine-type D-Ala-D-Ala carboxypeptidase/endopeptidase (penicillin-binding protein 4)